LDKLDMVWKGRQCGGWFLWKSANPVSNRWCKAYKKW
jgi:hypothetical protein